VLIIWLLEVAKTEKVLVNELIWRSRKTLNPVAVYDITKIDVDNYCADITLQSTSKQKLHFINYLCVQRTSQIKTLYYTYKSEGVKKV